MLPNYDDFLIKRFEQPDKVRTFEKAKFDTAKQNQPRINTDETQMEEGRSLEFSILNPCKSVFMDSTGSPRRLWLKKW